MGIDVYTFCSLACDDCVPCVIYDMTVGEEVVDGDFKVCMDSDYSDYDVLSFDVENGKIVLNIETDEDEEED